MTPGVIADETFPDNNNPPDNSREGPEFNLDHEDVRLNLEEPLKVIRREPQIPYPQHTHSFAELVIILSGTGHHRVAGQLRLAAASVQCDVQIKVRDRNRLAADRIVELD